MLTYSNRIIFGQIISSPLSIFVAEEGRLPNVKRDTSHMYRIASLAIRATQFFSAINSTHVTHCCNPSRLCVPRTPRIACRNLHASRRGSTDVCSNLSPTAPKKRKTHLRPQIAPHPSLYPSPSFPSPRQQATPNSTIFPSRRPMLASRRVRHAPA